MKLRLLALFFVFSMIFSLAACTGASKAPATPVTVRIYTLNGTTGFGIAKLMDDNAKGAFATEKYEINIKSDPVEVRDAMINGSIDIAAVPTNVASVLYNKTNGGVKVIAINTLGCLFLLNTGDGTVASFADLGGKTVYAPAQNPTFILTYLCQQNGLTVVKQPTSNPNEVHIDSTSYAQAADLQKVVSAGTVTLAVLPEPMVTIATNKGKANEPKVDVKVAMDLTQEWDKLPGKANTLVQGCVVVRNEFLEANPTAVANFLKAYENSINYLNTNTEDAANLIATYKIFENANIAKVAIPKCNVKYVDGAEMKTAINTYLEILQSVNGTSIGGAVPGDDFYYIPQ